MAKLLDTKELSDTEDGIFEREFDNVFRIEGDYRDFVSPFIKNKAYIKYALKVAKGTQGPGGEFGGRGARGGQLGWEPTRAQTLRSSTYLNWEKTWAAAGYQDFQGTSAAKVAIHEDALVVFVGIVNHNPSPKLTKVIPNVMGDSLNIESMEFAMLHGARVHGFDFPFIVPSKEQWYMRGYVQAAGADEPQMLAVTYAKSSYLQNEAATTQSGGT